MKLLLKETALAEGHVDVTGGRVWYERLEGGTRAGALPVLLLHGGPGFTHHSFEPLRALAGDRPVIWYDQLGSGFSDRPEDPALWTTGRFVAELGQVRAALDLDEVHILGHSWGTMLLAAYLVTNPAGVRSAVFSSPCLSARRWAEDQKAYVAKLSPEHQAVIRAKEMDQEHDPVLFKAAVDEFYRRHLCRLHPWPACVLADFEHANMAVYEQMWGPSEFLATGSLADFDATGWLAGLRLPALFSCGRFDEATPESTKGFASLVPGSELHIYERSSHMCYVEEPEAYLAVVGDFLARHDELSSEKAQP